MEYKFRGKRIDNGEWIYGSLISWPGGDMEIASFRSNNEGDKYIVVPSTVGQFTGLKDKNGKEIYEGDILKSFSPSVPSYEVFYCRSSYRLRYKLKNGEWYDWGPLFRMEEIQWEGRLPLCPDVIGNIHDNPELLNPAGGQSSDNNMNIEPNAKPEQEVAGETANAGQQNAQESAAQDAATGAGEATPGSEGE